MNKILLTLITFICINISVFAQDDNVNFFSEEEVNANTENGKSPGSGTGGVINDDYVPIDNYIPLLILVSLGVAFRYRKVLIKN